MDLQNKTLFDLFSEALDREDDKGLPGWYYYEHYVEYRKKYLQALLIESEVAIYKINELSSLDLSQDDVDTTTKTLMTVYKHFFDLQKEAFGNLIKILDEHASLSRVKSVDGYTEFDSIEWSIDEFGKISIHYKPKGVNVSHWRANPKHIEVI